MRRYNKENILYLDGGIAMRILMLGNSFTYFNDMPEILAALTGWEVVSHTRGGAYLHEHLDPTAELGQKTLPALRNERYDYVVMQGQSQEPFRARALFLDSVSRLCPMIRTAGATPVLYATWAYREGTQRLSETGLSYDQMLSMLTEGYEAAAKENGALLAPVGQAFTAVQKKLDLYVEDDYHPSQTGSLLAAATIARCIFEHAR